MPRIVRWVKQPSGARLRKVIVTWSRPEFLARIKLVPTFRHKRLVAKDYMEWREREAVS